MAAVRDAREAYLWTHNYTCLLCGSQNGVAVHEISDGPLRDKSLSEPYTWLCLCWTCNSQSMKDAKLWPEAKQLALKYLTDNLNFDLVKYNTLVNSRAMNRITIDEVMAFVEQLTTEGK